jgi:hypothetical protein
MDKISVDGAIFISAFSLCATTPSCAVEVQRGHSERFAIVKPVDPADPAVADVVADRKKTLRRRPHHPDEGGEARVELATQCPIVMGYAPESGEAAAAMHESANGPTLPSRRSIGHGSYRG